MSQDFNNWLKAWRIGVYLKDPETEILVSFYIFEIFVLMFVSIHILIQISLGLWNVRENDIETTNEAIQRLYKIYCEKEESLLSDDEDVINLKDNLIDKN
jgi:hypothetical protein